VRSERDGKERKREGVGDGGNGSSAKRGRHGVDFHKTVGRLKQYFGITGGCRASSSNAAAAEMERKPDEKPQQMMTGRDVDELERKKMVLHQRKRSQSDPLDPTSIVRRIANLESKEKGVHGNSRNLEKSGSTSVTMMDGETLQNQLDLLYGPGFAANIGIGRHGSGRVRNDTHAHRSRSKVVRDKSETVATVVPGVRVRVGTSSRRSHSSHHGHHRHRRHSRHASMDTIDDGFPQGFSATVESSRSVSRSSSGAERAKANVERWLLYNQQIQQRKSSTRTSRHRHDRSSSHRIHDGDASSLRHVDRSASASDFLRSEYHSTRQSSVTMDSLQTRQRTSSVTDTIERSTTLAGLNAGESRLGPSLVQFVAELIEGLEKNADDDDE